MTKIAKIGFFTTDPLAFRWPRRVDPSARLGQCSGATLRRHCRQIFAVFYPFHEINSSRHNIKAFEIRYYNAKKKAEDDILKAEADAAWAAWLQSQADEKAAAETAKMQEEQAQLDLEAKQAEQDRLMYEGIALRNQESLDRLSKQKEEAAKKDAENEAMWRNNSLNAAQSLNSSLQSLSDSYFFFKTKNLQKGSAEELKQAKKQFDINKGLSIASATISGIQGVVNALSAQSVIPEPFGSILKGVTAVAVGASAAANIAKIASSKFDAGGGGGGAAVASVPVPAPPTINIPTANTNSSTLFDESGKKIGGEKETKEMPVVQVRSTVSVTEINEMSHSFHVTKILNIFSCYIHIFY